MKGKQIMFFSTKSDLAKILQLLESTFPIRYFEAGMFETKIIPEFDSSSLIPNLGSPAHGDWNMDKAFVIIPHGNILKVREVPQRAGGVRYAVDLLANPEGAVIQTGGVFQEGILVAGTFGVVMENDFTTKIYKFFILKVKKAFKKTGAFYVGPEAMEKLTSGWRLVTNEKLAKGFDLIL